MQETKLNGDFIRQRRKELNMTQKQLGEAIGVSFRQISWIEKNVNGTTAARLFKLAKVLNVTIDQIFIN